MKFTFEDAQTKSEDLADNVRQFCKLVHAKNLGLGSKCGFLYYGPDFLAVDITGLSNLMYYGGFEYVDKDYILTIGELTLFSVLCPRVLTHWKHLK